MFNFGNANPPNPVLSKVPRTWDFDKTGFIGVGAYAVYMATLLLVVAMYDGKDASPAVQFQAYGAGFIAASILPIAVLWVAIRWVRRDFVEYLALNWPSSGELLRALAIMTILMSIESGVISLVRPTTPWPNPYVNANWGLLTFLIGGCITVPVMEEFVVRGFVFRGWSESFFGPVRTIMLSSVLWALVHMQYDWFEQFWIFVAGLVLGYIRWQSNSTWLTVVLHSANNIIIFFAIGLYP
jgi:uncharacterized protein